jgi:predicted DNA-binding transcriptional regulator AlpA
LRIYSIEQRQRWGDGAAAIFRQSFLKPDYFLESYMSESIDLIDWQEMCAELGGVSRTTLWRGVKDGKFPPPIKLGPFLAKWRRGDGTRVIQKKLAERDGE